jgi:hypothetical protein
MEKIKTIIGKEWAEVFKNKLVLFTVAFLPLILVAMPLIMLAADSETDMSERDGGAAEPVGRPHVRRSGLKWNASRCT